VYLPLNTFAQINSMRLRKFRPGFFLRRRSAIRRNKMGGPDAALVILAQSNHGTGGDSSSWLGTSAFTFAFSPDREKWKKVRLKPRCPSR
jgi:hypothetical protein